MSRDAESCGDKGMLRLAGDGEGEALSRRASARRIEEAELSLSMGNGRNVVEVKLARGENVEVYIMKAGGRR